MQNCAKQFIHFLGFIWKKVQIYHEKRYNKASYSYGSIYCSHQFLNKTKLLICTSIFFEIISFTVLSSYGIFLANQKITTYHILKLLRMDPSAIAQPLIALIGLIGSILLILRIRSGLFITAFWSSLQMVPIYISKNAATLSGLPAAHNIQAFYFCYMWNSVPAGDHINNYMTETTTYVLYHTMTNSIGINAFGFLFSCLPIWIAFQNRHIITKTSLIALFSIVSIAGAAPLALHTLVQHNIDSFASDIKLSRIIDKNKHEIDKRPERCLSFEANYVIINDRQGIVDRITCHDSYQRTVEIRLGPIDKWTSSRILTKREWDGSQFQKEDLDMIYYK